MPAIFIKTWKPLEGSEALNRLLKVLIVAINEQCYSVDPPPPWFRGGDHLCPYGRKLIGSLVPVHSRSVLSNIYAFLDPSLKLVAFLLNCFTCFPIHNMIVLTDVVRYGWFMVPFGSNYAGVSCEILQDPNLGALRTQVISTPKPRGGGGVYRVTLRVYRNN